MSLHHSTIAVSESITPAQIAEIVKQVPVERNDALQFDGLASYLNLDVSDLRHDPALRNQYFNLFGYNGVLKRRRRCYKRLRISPHFRLSIHKSVNYFIQYLSTLPDTKIPASITKINELLLSSFDYNTAYNTLLDALGYCPEATWDYVLAHYRQELRKFRYAHPIGRYFYRVVNPDKYYTHTSYFGIGDAQAVHQFFATHFPYLSFETSSLAASYSTARYDEQGNYEYTTRDKPQEYQQIGEQVRAYYLKSKLNLLIS